MKESRSMLACGLIMDAFHEVGADDVFLAPEQPLHDSRTYLWAL